MFELVVIIYYNHNVNYSFKFAVWTKQGNNYLARQLDVYLFDTYKSYSQ